MKTLVIAPHMDDETLGVGGAIWKMRNEGCEVVVMAITAGVGQDEWDEFAEKRMHEFGDAAETLRFNPMDERYYNHNEFFGMDQALDDVHLPELARFIEEFVWIEKPDSIMMPFIGDLNRDHRVVAEATLLACRPHKYVGTIAMYEVPETTSIGLQPFRPNIYIDIGTTLDGFQPLQRKLEAVRCYESQREPDRHPRSERSVEAIAKTRGSESGFFAAEALQMVRSQIR